MAKHYTRVINAALRQPWALTADMMAVVWDILRFRQSGGRLTPDEIRARIGGDEDDDEESPRRQARVVRATGAGDARSVAVVPVYGVIAHRTFEASSGMTSTEMIGALLQRSLSDPDVGSIVLDISSPGGTVEGVPELADQVFKARKAKHIVAVANAQAASAAYWIGAMATELVVVPSGSVGSIGVFSLHEDWSKWLEKEGVSITPIQAGKRKLEGAPWAALDDEAKAHFQAGVDDAYKSFTAAVAKGRGVPVADVRGERFGEGRSYDAKDALARGLVDGIATFDEVVTALLKGGRATARREANATAVTTQVVALEPAAVRQVVEGREFQGEFVDATKAEDDAGSDECQTCHGTGLKPERAMSDPQGQEPCPDCEAGERERVRQQEKRESAAQAPDDALALQAESEHMEMIYAETAAADRA